MKRKNKIIVAMSGGIDSSVAAALLKKASFDIIGVFMKFWSEKEIGKNSHNKCCSPESEKRARFVAKILNIPFYVFNFEKEFKEKIVNYFIKGYESGITPNACVVCNKEIKFGLLLEKALNLGVNYIATGHYARTNFDLLNHLKNEKVKDIRLKLFKGKDKFKDQSYFLWMLNQEQLKRVIFPVGNYTKIKVREIAKKFKLPFSNVIESMDICFIPNSVKDFLKKYITTEPGKIYLKDGSFLGTHEGLAFYTIGQRRGINIAGGPYYVLEKDIKNNALIVTKDEKDLYKKSLSLKNVNWISGENPKNPINIKAKIRYHHQSEEGIIEYDLKLKTYILKFKIPQRAITPGQSAVFYKGSELIGGGIIH